MLGYLYVLIAVIVYGFYPIASHYLVAGIDPIFLIGASTIVSAVPFVFYLLYKKLFSRLFLRKYLWIFITIGILGTLANVLFFIGTGMTSGLNTSLLLQVEPIYSVILTTIFLGEKVRKREFTAMILMVLGAVIVVYKGGGGLNMGDIFIVLSPVLYQAYHMMEKWIMNEHEDANLVGAGRLLYGGIMLMVIALVYRPTSVLVLTDMTKVVQILLFGTLLSLCFFAWYQAVKRLPLSKVTAFLPLSAGVSFIGSVFFLKEVPTVQHYVGLTLILAGLMALTWIHFKGEKVRISYGPEI